MHVVSYSHSASIQSVIELELNGHACLYIGNSINKIDQYTMYMCLVRFLCDYWNIVIHFVNDILMVHLLNTGSLYQKQL